MFESVTRSLASIFGAKAGDGRSFHPSQTCPECGSKLCAETDAENWRCPNLDCPAQVRLGLVHWCSPDVMDIPGGNAALVARLVSQGLARDVAELYKITVAELAVLEGVDTDSAQKFFDAIAASLARDAWRVLFGLNIPLVGAEEAKALGRGFPSVDAVLAAGVPRLMRDSGVSEAVARSVVRWHGDSVNRKLVKRLAKAGLNFNSSGYSAPERALGPKC